MMHEIEGVCDSEVIAWMKCIWMEDEGLEAHIVDCGVEDHIVRMILWNNDLRWSACHDERGGWLPWSTRNEGQDCSFRPNFSDLRPFNQKTLKLILAPS